MAEQDSRQKVNEADGKTSAKLPWRHRTHQQYRRAYVVHKRCCHLSTFLVYLLSTPHRKFPASANSVAPHGDFSTTLSAIGLGCQSRRGSVHQENGPRRLTNHPTGPLAYTWNNNPRDIKASATPSRLSTGRFLVRNPHLTIYLMQAGAGPCDCTRKIHAPRSTPANPLQQHKIDPTMHIINAAKALPPHDEGQQRSAERQPSGGE